MRVCDWIAEYLYKNGVKRIHGLMGGGAAGLNDGFIKHSKLDYICYHHEQSAGHAAIGESKYSGNISVVNPTTGCGGTNCITSVLDAWQDSVPVIFISGNVKKSDCTIVINNENIRNSPLRKFGIQEHNIIETVKSITNRAMFVDSPSEVKYALTSAVSIAKEGRPGPVWIDIPSDIQTAEMPENSYEFKPMVKNESKAYLYTIKKDITNYLNNSKRPLILAGNGIRQSNTSEQFIKFIDKFQIPFVTSYAGCDIASYYHSMNIGVVGIRGSRAGNFALQYADLILILGSSLNASILGYNKDDFAKNAIRIIVDEEIINNKNIQNSYRINLNDFFGAFDE